MNIQFYYPRWGSESIDWNVFCRKVKQAGYDGVEAPVPEDPEEQLEIKKALDNNELLFIGQFYQSFEKDFEEHKLNYARHLKLIASWQPVKINAQTGKDYFSFTQNAELFAIAAAISRETGIAICHETHRNKALFAAHVTYHFLLQVPDLKITADFSHWCNVAESLLEDQGEAVALACKRVGHLHARIGHSQGAQVIDPRLHIYINELQAHLNWWDLVVQNYQSNKIDILTITTEFGPAPYMIQLPFTNMPIASQWDINLSMMHMMKERYGH